MKKNSIAQIFSIITICTQVNSISATLCYNILDEYGLINVKVCQWNLDDNHTLWNSMKIYTPHYFHLI